MIESRCGLHCSSCTWKESHGCGGCIETQGHPFYGECHIAHCCQDKELTHCGECDSIPCNKLYAYSFLDKEHGDKPPGERVATCRKWAADSGKKAWSNVLLTSAGFEDTKGNKNLNIINRFLKMLNKPTDAAKVLFIPTAAVDDESKRIAALCKQELVSLGILEENIKTHDMDGSLTEGEAMEFDVIYFTGGSTAYLLQRMKDTKFDAITKKMVYANKVYVGVSAGSIIATPSIGGVLDEKSAGLALVHVHLSVHQPAGMLPRADLPLPHIPLADNQALAVNWKGYEVI